VEFFIKMSLKLLAILGGVVALCTAPVISNTSHSVQTNSNVARVDRDAATIHSTTVQETNDQDMEGGDRFASSQTLSQSDRPSGLRNLLHRSQNLTERIGGSYSVQESSSSLNLDLADLRDPYTLTVRPSADAVQLKGTIKLNGKPLKILGKGVVKINLSPYLRKGRHKLQVVGSYRPVGASVEIALEGPSAETSQEVGGSGTINQTILIDVK
jgi:hypothetical protein